eukprot:m.183943 g.183943  ORF g.183943 m.183943 type:complete len:146 (-) comp15977_c0_seq1:171-608(-)
MTSPIVFEDIFGIVEKNPDGQDQTFLRVERIVANSENYETNLLLDVNTMIYPMVMGERFTLALARTLDESGAPDDGVFDQSGAESLADKYEYVMHGKVYRCEEQPDSKLAVFISFGGLLMRLKGDTRSLQDIELDSMLYVLIRKS